MSTAGAIDFSNSPNAPDRLELSGAPKLYHIKYLLSIGTYPRWGKTPQTVGLLTERAGTSILSFMDSITNPLGGNMDQNSRVGQKGDMVLSYWKNGVLMREAVLVELLDDKNAAVWTIRKVDTGEVAKVMANQIRFYN